MNQSVTINYFNFAILLNVYHCSVDIDKFSMTVCLSVCQFQGNIINIVIKEHFIGRSLTEIIGETGHTGTFFINHVCSYCMSPS